MPFGEGCEVHVQLGSSLSDKTSRVSAEVMQSTWLIMPGVAVNLHNSILSPGFENSVTCVFCCAVNHE